MEDDVSNKNFAVDSCQPIGEHELQDYSQIQQSHQQEVTKASKLDELSREDLVKLVKRQQVHFRETKRQLDEIKQQAQNYLDCKKSAAGGELLNIELADYKASLHITRKELQEVRKQLIDKENFLTVLTERISELTIKKEEQDDKLEVLHQNLSKAQSELLEKSFLITEKDTEIHSLNSQLVECRNRIETIENKHIVALQDAQKIFTEEREMDLANLSELKRLRTECEVLRRDLSNARDEYQTYKNKAEYILRSNAIGSDSATNCESSALGQCSVTNNVFSFNGNSFSCTEIEELLGNIKSREAKINFLSHRCSLLEDELHRAEGHQQNLKDQITSHNNSFSIFRQKAALEQEKLQKDCEKRIEEINLQHKKNTIYEREILSNTKCQESTVIAQNNDLRCKNKFLKNELEKLMKLARSSNHSQSVVENKQRAVTQRFRNPPPLNFDRSLFSNQSTFTQQGYGRSPSNSESSDNYSSAEDLRSLVNNLDLVGRQNLHENVASSTLQNKFPLSIVDSDLESMERGLFSPESFEELQRQLVGCQELLHDSEEENIRLTEQVRVLKNEIRRLEKDQEPEPHQVKNYNPQTERVEYLKNVILKFLTAPISEDPTNDVRVQLLPVLRTILSLNDEELEQVRYSCGLTLESATMPMRSEGNSFWLSSLFK